MILSVNTNLFLYAANPDSPHYSGARRFFADLASGDGRFFLCGLVLVKIYMQLRNPAVFEKPKSPKGSSDFCATLRGNPMWEYADYETDVAKPLWDWAADTAGGFREIIGARLALTLRHHGVTHFATANVNHFDGFEFVNVWNPLSSKSDSSAR